MVTRRTRPPIPSHVQGWKRVRFRAIVAIAEFFGVFGRLFRKAGLGDPGVRIFQLAAFAIPTGAAMIIVGASLPVALGSSVLWFALLWIFFKRNTADGGGWGLVLYIPTAIPVVLLITWLVGRAGLD